MKKFIQGKVMDFKFRKAGEGHSLNEEKKPPSLPQSQPAPRRPASSSSQSAGSAALSRLEQKDQKQKPRPRANKTPDSSPSLSSTSSGNYSGSSGRKLCAQPTDGQASSNALTAQVRTTQEPVVEVVDTASRSVLVHLICPICDRSVLHTSIHTHFSGCLQEEYLKEPLTSSVHMIHTLCKDQDNRKLCIDTLCKYFDNILTHPGEEKYTKIPMHNKTFKERVQCVQGATLFLEAVGFQQQLLPHKDGDQQFYVLPMDKAINTDELQAHRELLTSAQPLKTKVDRNLQVFRSSSRATHFDLPNDFFNLTMEEIKKEQKQRSEIADRETVLRTKVMRERDNMRMVLRHYRFTLLRIRMPDGLILQGVFRPMEKIADVRTVLSSVLVHQTHVFSLSALGRPVTEEDTTLAAAGMVPSAVLNFSWNSSGGPGPEPPFLTSDLLARVQELR